MHMAVPSTFQERLHQLVIAMRSGFQTVLLSEIWGLNPNQHSQQTHHAGRACLAACLYAAVDMFAQFHQYFQVWLAAERKQLVGMPGRELRGAA